MDDDLPKHLWRIRPQSEVGLADPTGGPGGPSLSGVFAGKVRPANQNEEMFTPEGPNMRGVSYFLTPEQKQKLAALGFQPWHIEHTSPEQARDIILQSDPNYDWRR